MVPLGRLHLPPEPPEVNRCTSVGTRVTNNLGLMFGRTLDNFCFRICPDYLSPLYVFLGVPAAAVVSYVIGVGCRMTDYLIVRLLRPVQLEYRSRAGPTPLVICISHSLLVTASLQFTVSTISDLLTPVLLTMSPSV